MPDERSLVFVFRACTLAGGAVPVTWTMDGATLTLVLEGAHAFSDITVALRAAFSDANFRHGVALLIDERRSTVNGSADEKRAQIAWIASRQPNIVLVALLTATDPSRYGMARMASVFFDMEGLEAQVFTKPEDAKRWLESGLPPRADAPGRTNQRPR
jgi:hypothetical protein